MPRPALTARLPSLVLLVAAGGLGIYLAERAAGGTAALLAAIALACAVVLLARIQPTSAEAPSVGRVFDGVVLLVPGALTVYLSFQAGGFFPAAPAFAAICLVVVLVLRVTLADRPFAGFGWPLGVATAALALYAGWILASATWSQGSARTLIEFDRALVYLLALVIFGSIPRSSDRLRWIVRGLAAGIVVVAVASLLTRLYPATFFAPRNLGDAQLSYPLTYSNTLGMLAVLGALFCLHLASSLREPLAVRALGAAAVPLLATTVYLTLSRGPVAAAAVGLVAYVVLSRSVGLLPGLAASVPFSVAAIASAYDNDLVTSVSYRTAAGAAQGRDLAVILALCVLGAGVVRLALGPADGPLRRISLPASIRRPVTVSAWAAAVVAVVIVGLAIGAPQRIADQYDRFVETAEAGPNEDIRESVFDPSNRGLIDNWSVALDAFADAPLRGQGAGMYEFYWNANRPAGQGSYDVTDAHSLYAEVLGELGLVGAALLGIALLAILAALAPVRRGPNRGLYAALFAATLAWGAHAAVEWDWEMPAVTLWLFAVGGMALARRRPAEGPAPSEGARVLVGALVLALAVTPGLVFASQRQLDASVDAFYEGRCGQAIDRASAAIETLAVRPEPYEVIAYCQGRQGNDRLAIRAMEEAVRREPANWKYHYGLAAMRAIAGLDALPAARAARRLGPEQWQTEQLLDVLREGSADERRDLLVTLVRQGRPTTIFR